MWVVVVGCRFVLEWPLGMRELAPREVVREQVEVARRWIALEQHEHLGDVCGCGKNQ